MKPSMIVIAASQSKSNARALAHLRRHIRLYFCLKEADCRESVDCARRLAPSPSASSPSRLRSSSLVPWWLFARASRGVVSAATTSSRCRDWDALLVLLLDLSEPGRELGIGVAALEPQMVGVSSILWFSYADHCGDVGTYS